MLHSLIHGEFLSQSLVVPCVSGAGVRRGFVSCLRVCRTAAPARHRRPSCSTPPACFRSTPAPSSSPARFSSRASASAPSAASVDHPQGARVIDLGDATLLPGLIDAHVHLFLHPGAEDLQTVEESVPWRTMLAEQAAKADLLAGFTAERDMGTEGAGSADTAVRDAINQGLIPGPRLRISGNAIDILGGHEDAIHFNPAQHVLSNADYANSIDQIDRGHARSSTKKAPTSPRSTRPAPTRMVDGELHTPYQYTEAQLAAAVEEAHRLGTGVAVHAMGEPGTLYAAQAGVASIDHATQLSDETMRLMREKQIPAVPTFAIFDYFAQHAHSPAVAAREKALLDYKIRRIQEADRRRHSLRRRL